MAIALLALQNQPGGLDLLDRVARLLTSHQDRIPRTRRTADPELGQNLVAQPALGEVGPCSACLRRISQEARVEARGALQQLGQPCPSPTLILEPGVLLLAVELDAVAVGQRLDRLGEPQRLLLLDELDHVAPDPAPEAVVELLLGVDRERRRALVVKRAQAREPGPRAPQVGVGRDDLDDVRRLLDPLDAGPREPAHSRDSSGSARRLKLAIAKRSVIPAM